jgi:hypothetical protein
VSRAEKADLGAALRAGRARWTTSDYGERASSG